MSRSKYSSLAAALSIIAGLGIAGGVSGQQPASAGSYTATQAAAGRQVYQAECAGCHRGVGILP